MGIKKRFIFLLLSGVLILGGFTASAMLKLDCSACKEGMLSCPECKGDPFLTFPIPIECACRGEKPDCHFCGGMGAYFELVTGTWCEACEGKRGKPCLSCHGEGKIELRERILGVQ